MGAGDRSLTPPPGAASTAATPRRRQRAAPDSDPGGRLHGRGGPPAGAIRRPRCRNILSDSPCPLGHARGRGPILSALTSMRRWCQRRTVLYWWPDYGRQRGTVARLSPRGASGFLHVVAHTRRGRLGCWRCAARRTPLLDAASCRDWPHWVLDASPACPSGPTADAARALGPGPPGPKFESSLRGAFAECLCNLSRGRLCDFPHGHKGYWFIQTAGWWPSKSESGEAGNGKGRRENIDHCRAGSCDGGVFFWQCWVPHLRYNRTHPPHKINNFLLPKPDRFFKNGYTLF